MKNYLAFPGKALVAAAFAAALATSTLHASWTTLDLPDLVNSFGAYHVDELPDGRFVYGSQNSLAEQTTFGASALSNFTGVPSWDPSGVAVFSNSLGAAGQGTFAPSSIYTFDPSNLTGGVTQVPGVSIQNYDLRFRDASSLYVVGLNGSGTSFASLPNNAVSYVTLSGTQKVIIDNVSAFSGDIAMDMSGNLYVSDDDTLQLYKFSAAQLSSAILGSALSITDGTYVTTIENDGSIAVDGLGRIWTAGFNSNGIQMYDPANGVTTDMLPALDNSDYIVSTFSAGGNSYVGYINASGSDAGSTLTYGYDLAVNETPEPSAAALILCGIGGLLLRRRRS